VVRLVVRLTPRGGADRIDGVGPDGVLRVRVAAPPADGQANEALVRLLAQEIGVPAGTVTIVRGERGRQKWLRIDGVGAQELRARWPAVRLE